jgi:hypothetical protein
MAGAAFLISKQHEENWEKVTSLHSICWFGWHNRRMQTGRDAIAPVW